LRQLEVCGLHLLLGLLLLLLLVLTVRAALAGAKVNQAEKSYARIYVHAALAGMETQSN
jgi:hypothetical protein